MFQAAVSGHLCGQAELGRRLGRRSAEEMEGLDTADERASTFYAYQDAISRVWVNLCHAVLLDSAMHQLGPTQRLCI